MEPGGQKSWILSENILKSIDFSLSWKNIFVIINMDKVFYYGDNLKENRGSGKKIPLGNKKNS